MRKIATRQNGALKAEIHHNKEYDEYLVKFYIVGVYQKRADYFTDDKSDAISTAQHWCNKGVQSGQNP